MRKLIYWFGWSLAVGGYLAVIIDIALLWAVKDHHSLLVTIFTGGGIEAVGAIIWATAAILCLSVED